MDQVEMIYSKLTQWAVVLSKGSLLDGESLKELYSLASTKSAAVEVLVFAILYSILIDDELFNGLVGKEPELASWITKKVVDYREAVDKIPSNCFVKVDKKKFVNAACLFLTGNQKEVLPIEGKKNILITSAIPYVNNVPHLGNIIGCVLSADVYARYCRLRGYQTLYVCGTDEYGTATETKALEEGVSCQELCDKYYKLHHEIYKWFDIQFDTFGRSATAKQTEIAQDIFNKINQNNLFEKEAMEQLFCEKCSRFLADRFVEGQCPLCGYEDARGDQCDKCGKLINAIDLISPRCKLDGNAPVVKSSVHLFLNLPKLQAKCEEFVKNSSEKGFWSANSVAITNSWLNEGLKPRCITRDLKWGTPVPLEEMKEKVFYVWFDAPIAYISITANYTKNWEKWWKNPENVSLYQFMGKDNVPFHTVVFPCSLIGTGENYTLLNNISTTDYLNYEDGKFSKSRGVGVFGNNVVDSKIPVSIWRYYLLSVRPEQNDSVFAWDDFQSKTNNELLANLGNFVNRVLKFLSVKFDGILPVAEVTEAELKVFDEINKEIAIYIENMEQARLKNGLKAAMAISAIGNLYLSDSKLDNSLFLNNPIRCGTVVNVAVNIIYLLSALLNPFIPTASNDILEQLDAPPRIIPDSFTLDILGGHRIGTPGHLFRRLEDDEIKKLKALYSGKQVK